MSNSKCNDWGREVKIRLLDRHMTVAGLADVLNLPRPVVSIVVNRGESVMKAVDEYLGTGRGSVL